MVKLAQISVIKWYKYSIRLPVRKFNQWFDPMVNRECVCGEEDGKREGKSMLLYDLQNS